MKKKSLFILITMVVFFPVSVYAYCPLGENVTKDLYGVLKILQIVAPVMCIGFSVYEVVKTLAKGDASADLKKIATRFGKRVIYTIILFFLPILIDQVMQIADVWDANGTCDLTNPTSNSTDESRCNSVYNSSACNSVSGCYWSNDDNSCHTSN